MSDINGVSEKAVEIQEALAQKTGVPVADVEKILTQLGLEKALHHRASDPPAGPSLSQVSLETIRIAAGGAKE